MYLYDIRLEQAFVRIYRIFDLNVFSFCQMLFINLSHSKYYFQKNVFEIYAVENIGLTKLLEKISDLFHEKVEMLEIILTTQKNRI